MYTINVMMFFRNFFGCLASEFREGRPTYRLIEKRIGWTMCVCVSGAEDEKLIST